MNYLLWFILGSISIDFILPIVEKLGEWIITTIQFRISCIQVDMTKLQQIVDKMQDNGENSSQAIGFALPDEEYKDDDDDE